MAQKPKFNSIQQTVYDEGSPQSLRITNYGKTSGGTKVPILVASDGTVQTSATLSAASSQVVVQANASSLNANVTFGATANVQVVQASAGSLNATVTISGTPNVTVGGGSLGASQIGTWTVQPGNTPNTTQWLVNASNSSLYAIQSGNWTVQPGNTPNTTQWLVNASNSSLYAIQSGTWNVGANGGSLSAILLAGTAEIGNVKNSGTFATQATIQAGNNAIGITYDRPDVLNLSASLSAVAPQFAVINVATAGDNTIVAATTSKKTVVLAYALVVGTGGDGVTWKQGATAVSGQMRFAANGGISAGYSPVGHFQTASGATLYLNSSLGSQISGHITYVVV